MKMKVLVLGASGMLGHKLLQTLGDGFEVAGTVRGTSSSIPNVAGRIFPSVNLDDIDGVTRVVDAFVPDAVVNCVGVVKQLKDAEAESLVRLNALAPHLLAKICRERGARLVHISTDCVFSGRAGNYSETDLPDPPDMYGRSKLLGEVEGSGCITLRTSFIGRELGRHTSLVDWFILQRGKVVNGYRGAIYSGLTAQALSREIARVLARFPDMTGVWHVSADPISKFDLLGIVNREFKLGIDLRPDEAFLCDRSLSSARYRSVTGFKPLSWDSMIHDMVEDSGSYAALVAS